MTRRSKYALSLLAALVAAGLLLQTPLLHAVRGQLWRVWTATLADWFKVGPLAVPNNVSEQLARLTAENTRLKAQQEDYRRLKRQLATPSVSDFHHLKAHVSARPLDAWQTHYLLNRGARDGVNLGAPAVIRGSVLVGFITELHERTSVLQLLYHPSTSLPAEVMDEGLIGRALVQGRTYTGVELVNLPRDIPIKEGQEVVTIQQGQTVPAGLVIGSIETILADEPHEPYYQARLRVPYDASRLDAVTILTVR